MEGVKALVTGFEPFGGDAINPSSLAVSRLPDRIGDTEVRTAVLPCSFARSADVLRAANGLVAAGLIADWALGGALAAALGRTPVPQVLS